MVSSGWCADSRERMDQLGLVRMSDGEGLVDIWRIGRIDWRIAIRQLGQIGMVLELKQTRELSRKAAEVYACWKSARSELQSDEVGKLPSQPHTPTVTVAHPCWRHTYRVSLDALPTSKLHLQRLPLRHS